MKSEQTINQRLLEPEQICLLEAENARLREQLSIAREALERICWYCVDNISVDVAGHALAKIKENKTAAEIRRQV
jgi:hypothetical protein